jgi:hypothetical protein
MYPGLPAVKYVLYSIHSMTGNIFRMTSSATYIHDISSFRSILPWYIPSLTLPADNTGNLAGASNWSGTWDSICFSTVIGCASRSVDVDFNATFFWLETSLVQYGVFVGMTYGSVWV